MSHVKGVRALPHAAAGAKLVAHPIAELRNHRRRALLICGLPERHLRTQAPVPQHSTQRWERGFSANRSHSSFVTCAGVSCTPMTLSMLFTQGWEGRTVPKPAG